MQNNLSFLRLLRGNIGGRIIFLLYLLPLISFTASAQTTKKLLDKRITISLNKETLASSIVKVETQSKVRIFYNAGNVKAVTKTYSNQFNNETLRNILKVLLSGTGIGFQETSTGIILKENVQTISKETPAPKSPNVQAGQGPGTIKGRIVEFETSQPLPGASVRIIELNTGVSSDENGYYRLTNVPAGKYTLQVSYVSFNTEKVQVEAKAGQEETYDVKMQGSNSLQEVTVTAIAKTRRPVPHSSVKQVLEEVKSASLVVSAISSEQISKSADRNAAEAVQKVAGVTVADDKFVIVRGLNQRYNLTYLNDNVAPSTEVYSRAFALDLIPSRIIDRIMVYKSAGPETLADATGGVVKIYTKDAKTVKHFDMELQLGHRQGTTFDNNFLTYNGGKWDWLGVDDGTRKLPSSVPDYDQLNLAQLTPSQYAATFNPTLTHQIMRALPNLQLTANYYNAFGVLGKTISTLTSFSYKNEYLKADISRQEGYPEISWGTTDNKNRDDRNTQTAQLNLLQNFTLRLRDSSTLSFKNFLLLQGQDVAIVRHSQSMNSDISSARANKDNILSFNQRFLYAGNLGGIHYFDTGKHKVQWNGGYTFSQQYTPDQRVVRLTGPTSRFAVGDTTIQWRARGQNLEFSDTYDPVPMRLGIISRLWMRNSEGNYNASFDYNYQWKPWLSFRVGTFQQWKERRLYRRIYTVHEGDADNPEDVYYSPGGGGQYIDPQLVRFREQDLPYVWSGEYLRDDYAGLRVHDRTSGADSYTGTEQNNSGYFAVQFTPLDRKFEVYGGLRYEYNLQKIGAAIPRPTTPGINIPVYIQNPMETWLPSINTSWRPGESWVVRAAYAKTVNRTEFREVAPYQELDFESNTEISGNPDLQSATINNYDFRVEFYPHGNAKGETISAGVFYKELSNPIERVNTSNRVMSMFPSISYQNAVSATIKGLEIEMNKKLDFIPGELFRNLTVIANVSLIKSETLNDSTNASSLSFTTDKRPLQGQSPYIINAGLYYDNAAWGTRIAAIYNTSGENIYAAGRGYRYNDFINGPVYRSSLIELPRHVLDISVTQRIAGSLQAKLSIQNLLDQSVRIAEDFNFSNKYEPLRATGEMGEVEGRPVMDGDNIASSFHPGRHVVLNLSYSF